MNNDLSTILQLIKDGKLTVDSANYLLNSYARYDERVHHAANVDETSKK